MIVIFEKTIAIIIGSLLIGIGINGFLVPHHLLDGGVTGIALILHYYYDFPTGTTMFLLSLPLFIYAYISERNYFYNNFLGLVVAAIVIDWLGPLRNHFPMPAIFSAIFGGVFIGVGVGLMLRYKVSTGGTDFLAQFISDASKINVGVLIFFIDGLIVTGAFNLLGFTSFLYSCLAITIIGILTSYIARPLSRYKR